MGRNRGIVRLAWLLLVVRKALCSSRGRLCGAGLHARAGVLPACSGLLSRRLYAGSGKLCAGGSELDHSRTRQSVPVAITPAPFCHDESSTTLEVRSHTSLVLCALSRA